MMQKSGLRPQCADRENQSCPATEKVIFLDRDGTLNEEVNYLHRPEDLRILPSVPEALRLFHEAGFRLVVVTNQAGVARGYYGEADVTALHAYMNERLFALCGVKIDHFFYCPHHPEHGSGKYKVRCRCRKPGTGMFEMAEQFYQVDQSRSWMIGDKLIDIQAGINYGVRTALVGTGYGAKVHEEELAKLAAAGYEASEAGAAAEIKNAAGGLRAAAATHAAARYAAPGDEKRQENAMRLPYDLYAPRLALLAQEILAQDGGD